MNDEGHSHIKSELYSMALCVHFKNKKKMYAFGIMLCIWDSVISSTPVGPIWRLHGSKNKNALHIQEVKNGIIMNCTYSCIFYLLYHFTYRYIIAHIFETIFCGWQLSNTLFLAYSEFFG